jgi:hypothetical protein
MYFERSPKPKAVNQTPVLIDRFSYKTEPNDLRVAE